jgi:hypothetical protein
MRQISPADAARAAEADRQNLATTELCTIIFSALSHPEAIVAHKGHRNADARGAGS